MKSVGKGQTQRKPSHKWDVKKHREIVVQGNSLRTALQNRADWAGWAVDGKGHW